MEEVNKRRRNFLSLFKFECGPQDITSKEISLYIRHFPRTGINATKFEKTLIHFKSDVFTAVAVGDAKAL